MNEEIQPLDIHPPPAFPVPPGTPEPAQPAASVSLQAQPPSSPLYRYISPVTLRRAEKFMLLFLCLFFDGPTGKNFLHTHTLLAELLGCAYVAWKTENSQQQDRSVPAGAGL